jgi:uncharacterized phiE125 gp8 family phage protein
MSAIKVYTAATTYPVTLAEAKLHLRVDGTDEDTLINALIAAATQQAENYTWRTLMTTVYEYIADSFSKQIELDTFPIATIDSIKYYDLNNVQQTLIVSAYESNLNECPVLIRPKENYYWPDTIIRFDAVTVRFTAGYASAAAVPAAIKQAILMIVGHLYANREDVVTGTQVNTMPQSSQYLLNTYRVNRFV